MRRDLQLVFSRLTGLNRCCCYCFFLLFIIIHTSHCRSNCQSICKSQRKGKNSLAQLLPSRCATTRPTQQNHKPQTQDTMRFISALLAGALAVVASAQTSSTGPNPFTNSDFTGIVAGEPFTITWDPTTEGTVTLQLVQGDPSALDTVETIEGEFTSCFPLLPFNSAASTLLSLAVSQQEGNSLCLAHKLTPA